MEEDSLHARYPKVAKCLSEAHDAKKVRQAEARVDSM
jgi:hypothetical protein